VCIPLKANLFAAEILTFSEIYKEFHVAEGGTNAVEEFIRALAAYLVLRFPGIFYFTDSESVRFIFGSISWAFLKSQKIEFTDVVCADPSQWMPLAPDAQPADLPSKLQQLIDLRRSESFSCYELFFDAKLRGV
jgi:hypothetical protein